MTPSVSPTLRVAALALALVSLTTAASTASSTKGIQRVAAAGAPAAPPMGVRALVVGIDDYKNLPADQDILTGASDARLIGDTLRRTVDPADLVVLTNQEATNAALRKEVSALLQRTTEREVAMLFVVTHGARVGQKGYLLASDSQPEGRLPATALNLAQLKREVAASKAGGVFLFMDTVHAELKDAAGGMSGPEHSVSALIGALASARPGVFALLSEEVASTESACPGNGAYACALSQALLGRADANGDASVTLGEVARIVPSAMRAQPDAPLEVAAYGTYDAGLAFLTPTTSFEAAAVAPARWTRPPNHLDVCLYANGQPVPPEHTSLRRERRPRRGGEHALPRGRRAKRRLRGLHPAAASCRPPHADGAHASRRGRARLHRVVGRPDGGAAGRAGLRAR